MFVIIVCFSFGIPPSTLPPSTLHTTLKKATSSLVKPNIRRLVTYDPLAPWAMPASWFPRRGCGSSNGDGSAWLLLIRRGVAAAAAATGAALLVSPRAWPPLRIPLPSSRHLRSCSAASSRAASAAAAAVTRPRLWAPPHRFWAEPLDRRRPQAPGPGAALMAAVGLRCLWLPRPLARHVRLYHHQPPQCQQQQQQQQQYWGRRLLQQLQLLRPASLPRQQPQGSHLHRLLATRALTTARSGSSLSAVGAWRLRKVAG